MSEPQQRRLRHQPRADPPERRESRGERFPPGSTVMTGEQLLSDRIWTVPNIISMARIGAIFVFIYLLLGPADYQMALIVLALAGISDWLDGKIARVFNLQSRLGQVLDPAADRLFIILTPIAFLLAGLLPWWLVGLLLLRDLALLPAVVAYSRRGVSPPVTYIGKSATFALMWAFPLHLVATAGWAVSSVLGPLASALYLWGGALYLISGLAYLMRFRDLLRTPVGGGQPE